MTTKIYKTYSDFFNRENKAENGVSELFSEDNPNYEEKNKTNKACWNCRGCRGCSDCSYCSYCSGCRGCSYCSDCSDCRGCSYCSYCSDCSDCRGCSYCSYCSYCSDCRGCRGCSYCSDCSDKKGDLIFPVIENIHTKILEAVTSNPDALNMCTWHTCNTTHCRAGWVVVLAGEAGAKLEEQTSTPFAAMMIYKASSPIRVSPVRFYEDDETAMKDIKRCAEEESKLIS